MANIKIRQLYLDIKVKHNLHGICQNYSTILAILSNFVCTAYFLASVKNLSLASFCWTLVLVILSYEAGFYKRISSKSTLKLARCNKPRSAGTFYYFLCCTLLIQMNIVHEKWSLYRSGGLNQQPLPQPLEHSYLQ
jgi:hypothetical protein